jgi:hypothetical protein
MALGEGNGLIAAAVAVAGACGLIAWLVPAIVRDWEQRIASWPSDEDDRAEAMVPEFAAARSAPRYSGRCRCTACRTRPTEPCSDFDGN